MADSTVHRPPIPWLALAGASLPEAPLSRLLDHFGTADALLGALDAEIARVGPLQEPALRRLRESERDIVVLQRQAQLLEEFAIRIIVRHDDEYPARLSELPEAPPILFLRGTLNEEDRLAVALVGPRMATAYGLEVTRRLATELAPIMTIVSGLAVGIDSTAHRCAIEAGGRTLGVAACGLDQDYPKGNAPLRDAIPAAGALLSIYPPLTKAATHHFPARNHLMAALSLAVVVVEASDKSGALVTAEAATELGREVLAVPGDITRINSLGTNRLIANGATMVTIPRDVVEALEQKLDEELRVLRAQRAERAEASAPPPPDTTGLPPAEQRLLDTLRHAPQSYDDLVAALVPGSMSLGELTTALLMLELKGLLRQLPGKVYQPTI